MISLYPSRQTSTITLKTAERTWIFTWAAVQALTPFWASLPRTLASVVTHCTGSIHIADGSTCIDYFGLPLRLSVAGTKVTVQSGQPGSK